MKDTSHLKIAVIGLGYVGLPLAVEFGRKRSVLGFDINPRRIGELSSGKDSTLEVSSEELKTASVYDGIILAVAHDQFRKMGSAIIRELGKSQPILYDLKYLLPQYASDLEL